MTSVELTGVSKWFGLVLGLNDVSVEVDPGITGLLGPNGAGKSTLMRIVTGELRPSMGDVRVFGKQPSSSPDARRRLGFVPEVDSFYEEMSGREFLRAMGRASGLPREVAHRRVEAVLELVGMASQAGKRLKACSKGMRQRIKIAQALVHEPEVLVLDEPMNGVDAPGRIELLRLFRALREQGRTLLLSTHILGEVEEATDRVILMARGRVLAQGGIAEIRRLLVDHPLLIRLSCTRCRVLGAQLLGLESVLGIALDDAPGTVSAPALPAEGEGGVGSGAPREGTVGDLVVRVRQPDAFLEDLPARIEAAGARVERLQVLDASAEAVFRYVVEGRGASPGEGDRS